MDDSKFLSLSNWKEICFLRWEKLVDEREDEEFDFEHVSLKCLLDIQVELWNRQLLFEVQGRCLNVSLNNKSYL